MVVEYGKLKGTDVLVIKDKAGNAVRFDGDEIDELKAQLAPQPAKAKRKAPAKKKEPARKAETKTTGKFW